MSRRSKPRRTQSKPTPTNPPTPATDLRESILADFAALKLPLTAEQFDAVLAGAAREGPVAPGVPAPAHW